MKNIHGQIRIYKKISIYFYFLKDTIDYHVITSSKSLANIISLKKHLAEIFLVF